MHSGCWCWHTSAVVSGCGPWPTQHAYCGGDGCAHRSWIWDSSDSWTTPGLCMKYCKTLFFHSRKIFSVSDFSLEEMFADTSTVHIRKTAQIIFLRHDEFADLIPHAKLANILCSRKKGVLQYQKQFVRITVCLVSEPMCSSNCNYIPVIDYLIVPVGYHRSSYNASNCQICWFSDAELCFYHGQASVTERCEHELWCWQ